MDGKTLEKAQALKSAVEQARTSLAKMEEKKAQVKAAAYQKVRAEYDAKLAAARQELDALLPQITAHAKELSKGADDAGRRADECAELEDELSLRHHIGELPDAEYTRRSTEAKTAREKAHAEQQRSQAELSAIQAAFKDEITPASTTSRIAVPPATPAPPPTPPEPHAAQKTAPPSAGPPPIPAPPPPTRQQIESALGDPFAEVAAAPAGPNSSFSNPALYVKSRTGEEESYWLDLGEFTIGRSAENDLVIDEDGVQARHAVVRLDRDHYMLAALTGDAAIQVNGKPAKSAPLKEGDTFRIGKSEITFRNMRWEA